VTGKRLKLRLKLHIKQKLLKLNHQASFVIFVLELALGSSPLLAELLFQVKTDSSTQKVSGNWFKT